MCGICGIAFADRYRTVPIELLERMNATLRFRGPDAEGRHVDGGTGVGHRRLSVIDLSGRAQPMTDPSGRVTVTFNGESYNFRELRDELQAAGFQFLTASDTEVLLLGYLYWGEAVVERLLGMFAFGLWDRGQETLLLARDRLGVKPLYWAETAGRPRFRFRADHRGGQRNRPARLATARRWRLPGPGLRRGQRFDPRRRPAIAAGQRAALAAGGAPRNWVGRGGRHLLEHGRTVGFLVGRRGRGDAVRQFAPLLEKAAWTGSPSDVPLGALLSGGIDSTLVVALIRRNRPQLSTFSIGFTSPASTKRAGRGWLPGNSARSTTQEIARCDSPDLLLHVARHQDEPFADTSILPTHVLCRMAREHVTVALSGDGGDELLAGYLTHSADQYHRWAARLPRLVVRALQAGLDLPPENRRKVNWLFKAKQFLAGAHLDACDAHAWWRMLSDYEQLGRLLGNPAELSPNVAFGPFRAAYAEAEPASPLDRMLYVDYKTYLVDDILVKVDRASMAYGLEVRSPLLDHRLVELCASSRPS